MMAKPKKIKIANPDERSVWIEANKDNKIIMPSSKRRVRGSL
jgi:hypothetical protein